MKRENRYLVMKRKDVLAHLSKSEEYQMALLIEKVEDGRRSQGKPDLQCVVVESDWPEYEPVWEMIEKRVRSEQPAEPDGEKPLSCPYCHAVDKGGPVCWQCGRDLTEA